MMFLLRIVSVVGWHSGKECIYMTMFIWWYTVLEKKEYWSEHLAGMLLRQM